MTDTLERTATITVDSAALKLATAWAARALPTRPQHPALTGMLLTATDTDSGPELTVTAWDWNTLCSATVDADAHGDLGTVLVNGSLLTDIAAKLTGLSTLAIDGSELLARSGSGRSKYRLRLMNVDYPHYRPAPIPVGIATKLREAITRVAYAASKEPPSGTNLDVVSAEAKDGTLRLFCTDRYRMATAQVAWDGPDLEFAVDARRLAELVGQLGDWDVRIGLDPDRISIHAGGRCAVLGQIDGKYVSVAKSRGFYERPWTNGHAELDRADLLAALDDASPTVEREQSIGGTVRLAFSDGEVAVSSAAAELGASDSAAGCHLDGKPRTEMFVGDWLVQALKAVPADTVRISFGAPGGSPTMFSPLVDGAADLANSHIVKSKKF